MTYTLIPQLWYTITPATDCDVSTPNGISIHLPAGIQYFHFADGTSIDITGEAAVTQNSPLFRPASASALGGGYIESNLNVGHGAAAAVAAKCTLTPGDLSQGGTLTDGTYTLELDPPDEDAAGSTKAEGWVPVADAAAAGSVTFGEHEPVVFEEAQPTRATGWLQVAAGGGDWLINGEPLLCPSPYDSVEAWNNALSVFGLFCTDETIQQGSPKVNIAAILPGAAGNEITLESPEPDLWPVSGPTLTGGADASRSAADIAAVLEALDYISETQVDADEGGIAVTAAHAGVNDLISVEGGLFVGEWPPIGMQGGVLSYTLAEIAAAINDDATMLGLQSASVVDGKIVLTSNTPGAAANAVTYTATGCFGGGSVRQGSTVRGKDAVEQTAFKIYLNGAELDVEPAPLPTALTPATAMKNGGVYTVTAAGTALDFSAVTLPANATAEVWIECTAETNLTWPVAWMWLDGSAPDVKCNTTEETSHRYRIVVLNEGGTLPIVARVAYDYSTPLPTE